jgi:hypothetical protein
MKRIALNLMLHSVCLLMPLIGAIANDHSASNKAYLFAHQKEGDYWHLYYSVSLDGLHWTPLNDGNRVFKDYEGHPDICKGHDGRYYLIGNHPHTPEAILQDMNDKTRNKEGMRKLMAYLAKEGDTSIHFWVSNDLIRWEKLTTYKPNLKTIPDFPGAFQRAGAPKLFYDDKTKQYLISWNNSHDASNTNLPEPYWNGQRTVYVTSPDLKTFREPPRKLFEFGEMSVIDTIVRRDGDRYYAIFKDERYPAITRNTGKSVMIASAPALTGPYTLLGKNPVSPSWREAPCIIRSPENKHWYLYYEEYPGKDYGLSVAETLAGPWLIVANNKQYLDPWSNYEMTSLARHGGMLAITRNEYDRLIKAFPIEEESQMDTNYKTRN